MSEEEWLEQLKVDDEVALYSRFANYQIQKVAKRTPGGQIILFNGVKFDKRGREIGGDKWNSYSLSPITSQILADMQHRRLVSEANSLITRLANNDTKKWSDAHLEEFIEFVKKTLDKNDFL